MVATPAVRTTAVDRIWQLALCVAYRLALAFWFVSRPTTRGAYIAVWHAGRVLVIRNSYKTSRTLPAGGVKPTEEYLEAAVRELREEVGIVTSAEQLSQPLCFESREEFKLDRSQLFELQLDDTPQIELDHREVVEANFLTPYEALDLPLTDVARRYLQQCREEMSSSGVTSRWK